MLTRQANHPGGQTGPHRAQFCLVVRTRFFKNEPCRGRFISITTPRRRWIRRCATRCCRFSAIVWGNPSSVHHVGRKARALLDDARDRAAKVLGAKPSEIIFTSGGTESNNLAIFGTARLLKPKGRHLITSGVEHDAVLHCFDYLEQKEGFEVTRLPVDSEGRVSPDDLRRRSCARTRFSFP